jgi:hypothetical protein
MSVDIDLNGSPETTTFADADLPAGRYCFHVGAGGTLIVLSEEQGESRVDRVYSATAWQSARGDVWRKGSLLHA